MKKIFGLFIGIFAILLVPLFAQAAGDSPQISAFVRDDCAHCVDLKTFVEDELLLVYPELEVRYYDIYEEKALFDDITDTYNLVKGTPITLVQHTLIEGFASAETTGKQISELLDTEEVLPGTFEDILDGSATVSSGLSLLSTCQDECVEEGTSFIVHIPFTSKTIDVGKYSLGGMAIILGFVDGFNPCALWVLIMFLMILSQLGSKKKMWQYAGIFILAEAIMYYAILNVWLTTWDFISLNNVVTPLIGVLALGSGVYFVYKFATYKPVCTVASLEQQKKISTRVKELAAKPLTIGVFFGILGLAFSVNIFEFACSIGIPQTFTKVLELNPLTGLQRQWYMFLYILMYMIDDVIIFGIALYGMDKIGVTHKYSKWATLVGGLCMLLLGMIMLLKPELLVF